MTLDSLLALHSSNTTSQIQTDADADAEQPEDPFAAPLQRTVALLMQSAPKVAVTAQLEESKDQVQDHAVIESGSKLSAAIVAKLENTKELTKKANVNRANIRRTIREMEEAGQKVDASLHKNQKNAEDEIAFLKKD